MKLRSSERDWYVVDITTSPALTGTWQASFDREATWVNGTATDGGWGWLVAGPDFDAAAVGMNPADTMATITQTVVPLLRVGEDPVLFEQAGPRIDLI